ncbi:hypothetical protein BKA23_2627 [Rudaeicoccus suwonensis]|uniref:Uncharacterized protein n=1 Tax=Rudaeicoccus suwonensis TaxID=657409 RepID=A0A561E3T3_9MICO|nr:hypothetical protein BKA23_2627 [Rudaeicoccus suwonensis]
MTRVTLRSSGLCDGGGPAPASRGLPKGVSRACRRAGFAVLPTWFSYLAPGAPGLRDEFAEPLSRSDAWIFIAFAVLLVLMSVVVFVVIRGEAVG